MNVLFFLTPKSQVIYIDSDFTIRQALEKMEFHRYSAMPIIDENGLYIGTITEGDLLWTIKKKYELNTKASEHLPILDVIRLRDNLPVKVDAKMNDLLVKVMDQNFVPIIDDQNVFIGIVTRKKILTHCINELK